MGFIMFNVSLKLVWPFTLIVSHLRKTELDRGIAERREGEGPNPDVRVHLHHGGHGGQL